MRVCGLSQDFIVERSCYLIRFGVDFIHQGLFTFFINLQCLVLFSLSGIKSHQPLIGDF